MSLKISYQLIDCENSIIEHKDFIFFDTIKKLSLQPSLINKCGCGVMAAAPDLGSGASRRGGSSPFTRTKINRKPLNIKCLRFFICCFSPHLVQTGK